jgi:hypothetical protein
MKKKRTRRPVNPKLPGRYGRMTARELDRETELFDREFAADGAVPLSVRQKAQELRARRRGRPRIGKGTKRVMVTVERDLLRATDDYARRHGLTRAALIARGLQSVIGKAG